MRKYNKSISPVRVEIEEARNTILEAYFSIIKNGYQTLDSGRRQSVLQELGGIVEKLDNGGYLVPLGIEPRLPKIFIFDGKEAKKIREREGLSIDKLAEELGENKSNGTRSQIINYEAGRFQPSNPPHGRVSKKYLGWLKEQGYNPFRL